MGKLFNRKEINEVTEKRAKEEGIINIEINQASRLIIKEAEKTKALLEKCKTTAEIDKVMAQYRKNVARIKAMKKAGKTIIVVSAAAMIAWLHHTKKVEIERHKKELKTESDKLSRLETKFADEQKLATHREDVLKLQLASANSDAAYYKGIVKELKENTPKTCSTEAFHDQLQVVSDLQKASIEITRDKVTATTDQVKEIISSVTTPTDKKSGEKTPTRLRDAMMVTTKTETKAVKLSTNEPAITQVFSDTALENIRKAIAVLGNVNAPGASRAKAKSYLQHHREKLMLVKDAPIAKVALRAIS